ncbi:hypothetical protein PG993_011504 [Apiospora rasikravindrae]|uniref:Uncharacterized protein n=1 Tax=Apiospora rasikravindrae TaxID=990691 RepID=A0ABR1SEL7_9PEZI
MPRIGELRIFLVENETESELPPTSTRYQIIEAAIHLALSLLESEKGRQSLVDVAKAILEEYNDRGRGHIYRDSLTNLPGWIDRFLKCLRGDFPSVYISEGIPGEAQARRHSWGNDMKKYEAPDAVDLFIHKVLIDNVVYCRNNPEITGNAYQLFKFQLGVVIAHEFIHCLTGFFTGTSSANTPPNVTLPHYGNTRTGEAGRFWESKLLGGVLEMWSSPEDGLGVRQPGTPYLFEGGGRDKSGRRVSMEYISDFNKGDFSFPIRTSSQGPAVTRKELEKAKSKETTEFRKKRPMRNAPAASSPPPGASSSSLSYRRLPTTSQVTTSRR